MSWKNVKLILHRELRDQLRDRRTLFMVAVLPLLLYPALGIGMMQMTMLFTEQPRTVVIVGAKNLPARPQLVDGSFIASTWFNNPFDGEKLDVITDTYTPDQKDEQRNERVAKLLKQAARFHEPVKRRQEIKESIARSQQRILELRAAREAAETRDDVEQAGKLVQNLQELKRQVVDRKLELDPINDEISALFAVSDMEVLIVVPDGFAERISSVNAKLKARTLGTSKDDYYFGPATVANRADEKSLLAYNRVLEALRNWEKSILEDRLQSADLPQTLAMPVNPDPIDVAQDEEIAANLWSKLFPALLVIMAVTGAFYPAVDLAAGEKERGTMETLLICPAKRSELVMGKFLTVMVFSMSTALLNLVSIGMTGSYMVSLSGKGAFSQIGDMTVPPPMALFWVVVLLIPLAALFSALCLALATFARSTKEGQYYLTPLLMVTLGLTVFCLSPAVEINAFYSVMPIVGVALLLKGLLLAPTLAGGLYVYVIPVLVTSIGYSLLALWWAIEQFKREEVLFREAERFEVGLWVRHLFRDKEATPSFAEGGFCFVMIMLLQFATMKFMAGAVNRVEMASSSPDAIGFLMMKLLLIQQLAIIASPALFMGLILTTDFRRTFRVYWPKASMLAAAITLPLALHPLSVELVSNLQWFFPKLPEGAVKAMQAMSSQNQPLWLVLLAFAVAPAICEETAFRGFMLSGFNRSGRVGLAIVLSSLTFGIMHMIPQQVFNATLLGLVLGLIAIRSNSLLPGIAFHFIYNSLAVAHGRVSTALAMEHIAPTTITDSPLAWFVSLQDGGIRYQWPTLVLAAGTAIVLLRWLLNHGQPKASVGTFPMEASFAGTAPAGITKEPPVSVG